jgi:hypothetical protein
MVYVLLAFLSRHKCLSVSQRSDICILNLGLFSLGCVPFTRDMRSAPVIETAAFTTDDGMHDYAFAKNFDSFQS